MELRKGYKQTDVGVLPEDWDVKPLDEIADVKGGKRLPLGKSLSDSETPHPYIRVADMHFGGVSLSNIKYVPVEVFPFIKNYRIFSDDIFITVAGTLGIVGFIPIELNGASLTENADRITNINCNKDFLLYVLMSPRIQNTITSMMTVGAQPKLALTRIQKFQIPIPKDESEQRAIATALSDVDALLTALDSLIAKKGLVKQGAMQELLSGKRRLSGFSGEWEVINMAEHSTLKARIGWQGLTTAEYLASGDYYLITGTDFNNGKVDWEGCHFVEKERYDQDKNIQIRVDDVLITKDGTIGKVAHVDHLPREATLNSGVFVVRPKNNKYHPRYFYYVLSSKIFDDFLRQLQAGSTINHLYQKDFVNFNFSAPALEEQQAIAEILNDIDAEITSLETRREKTRLLKQGMMQELLTGRIRLVQP